MKGIFVFLLVIFFSFSKFAYSADKLTPVKISLYQPDKVLSKIIPNVNDLANFSKALEDAFINESGSIATKNNAVLSLVVIFNSQGKSRIWVTSESADVKNLFKIPAEAALKKTPVCKVSIGAAGFASTFLLNNGVLTYKDNMPPFPPEWTEFIKRNNLGVVESTQLFEKILNQMP